ncbi:TPA: helix-turn-helix transcriptional regulator [Listeria monocytogenes]|nr:helix-turn-helix transcriptional regulator [Listeria monocytogenes]HBL8226600.1 helix-turn-helix transcriptional regulator [Listeria monocytogenes]
MLTKLKDLRIESNLTYGEVAEKVGISKEYYWMIENGERDGYSYNTAKKIASVFDKKPDEIFGTKDN